MSRVCIIGLDSLSPELVFERFRGKLPRLAALSRQGVAARLESSIPPITVPAWPAMLTGVEPGRLGIYGFRDRADTSYGARRLHSANDLAVPTLWEIASEHGLASRVLGVPLTYPARPLRGFLLSGPETPGLDSPCSYPVSLAREVRSELPDYLFDVADFRTLDRARLLADLERMTEARFRLARAWVARDDWDLFVMVEIGVDRVHHGFWGSPIVEDYYLRLDDEVGKLLDLLRPEDVVMVVSDHGAQSMRGAVALNDWLIAQGYLVLKGACSKPAPAPMASLDIDWSRTRAWGEGGHVGRVYFNIAGREPAGIVPQASVAQLAREIAAGLCRIEGPGGERLATRVVRPAAVYRELRGVPPDLMVYFDDLGYRAVGSVGHPSLVVRENDAGPDQANHARHGVFIMRDGRGVRQAPEDLILYDVAPTVLDRLGVSAPKHILGRVVV